MANLPRRTMEEICTISGTKVPSIPAIPPDSVPNLDSIRKVYDIAFAPGLDKVLESPNHWFSRYGFDLLASNRNLLGLMLAYLTLVSNNHDSPINHNPTLVSQEARVTWAMLSLCTIPTLSDQKDDEADILARRFRAIESILTGEPLEPSIMAATTISMSEFVHQEPEDTDSAMGDVKPSMTSMVDATQQFLPDQLMSIPTVQPSPFTTQVAKRAQDFWSTLESIATSQSQSSSPFGPVNINSFSQSSSADVTTTLLPQMKRLLDGKENRDILYSLCLLGWGINNDPSSERELARRFLQNEFGGRANHSAVLGSVAGMCLRARDGADGGRGS